MDTGLATGNSGVMLMVLIDYSLIMSNKSDQLSQGVAVELGSYLAGLIHSIPLSFKIEKIS